MRVLRKHWLLTLAIAVALTVVILWETSLIPHYVNHCTYQYETYIEKCAADHILFVVFGETREFIEKYDKVIGAFSAVAVAFFTGTLWLSTQGLWRVTNNTLTHAQETTKKELRAWVLFGPLESALIFTGGTHLSFRLLVANYGQTPAQITRIEVWFSDREPIIANPPATRIIVRGEQFTLGGPDKYIHPDEFDTGFGEPFIFGAISYTDIFGQHTSRFCRRIIPGAIGRPDRLGPAGSPHWNAMDTDE